MSFFTMTAQFKRLIKWFKMVGKLILRNNQKILKEKTLFDFLVTTAMTVKIGKDSSKRK